MKTTVIGSGHAGLVYGACLAELVNLAGRIGADIVPDTQDLGAEYHGIGQEA